MNKYLIAFFFIMVSGGNTFAQQQYAQYVEAKTSSIDNEKFGIIRLSRKDNKVKVKYFATNVGGISVYDRYQAWAANKKVIAYSSGTYMDNCEYSQLANPIGLCIDQGNVINENLVSGKLDALAIVYATGGMAASDLSKGNLKVTFQDKTSKTLDIRGSSYQKAEFLNWAVDMEATVFQTHLFVFEDQIKVAPNSSVVKQERRFLAACKIGNSVVHYIVNLPTPSTLQNGVNKAHRILKEMEEVDQVVFMINLDTGCQNVFTVYDANATANPHSLLRGNTPLTGAVNLLAYYYE